MKKYIIIADWIKIYLTKEPYIFSKKLVALGDWDIIELSRLNIETIIKTKCIVLCITYDGLDISLLKSSNVFIIYKIDDLYPYKDIRNKCINCADMLIGPYQYLFNTNDVIQMYPKINNINSYHIPYSAVNEFYDDIEFNQAPLNKIFVSGYINEYMYPLRSYIKNNINIQNKIESLDHPSYNSYTHNIINKDYYKELNKYICCFTDALIYKYILLKVFEICSVGSLLLVEDSITNDLNKLGFYHNINCIMCNKINIEDKINWILNINNIENVNIIRKNGMELVRNKHNTNERAIYFHTLINNIFI